MEVFVQCSNPTPQPHTQRHPADCSWAQAAAKGLKVKKPKKKKEKKVKKDESETTPEQNKSTTA